MGVLLMCCLELMCGNPETLVCAYSAATILINNHCLYIVISLLLNIFLIRSTVIKEINIKKKNKRVKKVLPKKGALGDVIDLLSYTPFDNANSPNNKKVLSPNHKDIQADDVGVEDIPTNSNEINQVESNTLSHQNNTTPLVDKRWNGRERLLRKYANVRKKKTPRLNIIDAPASDDSKT